MKTKSRKQEERLAKTFKGIRIPRSGAMSCWKGDVDLKDWKIESKTTSKDFFSLKHLELLLIEKHSVKVGKKPAFIIEFLDNNIFNCSEYVIIRYKHFISSCENISYLKTNSLNSLLVSNKKSFRLKKDVLDENWLNDILTSLWFNDIPYVILHLLDFLKIAR